MPISNDNDKHKPAKREKTEIFEKQKKKVYWRQHRQAFHREKKMSRNNSNIK